MKTKNPVYDYLIVGTGLFGSVFAHVMTKNGKKCLVIDKRDHLGGNIYCEAIEGINVHKYGPHIFHTSKMEIWDFVSSFVEFNHFIHSPLASYKDNLYNLPFNMNTFYQVWKIREPDEARQKIKEQVEIYGKKDPANLEEKALSLIGHDLYHYFVKGYTEKQWGRDACDVPAFIIERLPLRFTFDNNYFDHPYQGIPKGGYNVLINKLLAGIEVKLGTNFNGGRVYFEQIADKILFTGPIDEFYNFQFGKLSYRSLRFEEKILNSANYQGNAVINYTEKTTPHTRVIEHKHFEFGQQEKTVLTTEYPEDFNGSNERYYPVNDQTNNKKYEKYKCLAGEQRKYLFGGRLGSYKYLDMDDAIDAALQMAENEINHRGQNQIIS